MAININDFWSYFILIEIQFNKEFAFVKFDKIVIPRKKPFLMN